MNSRKPTTEIVGKENKEKTIASTPKYTGTQGPTSVVKPGDSLNGTKSTNNDEVRESRAGMTIVNAQHRNAFFLTAFRCVESNRIKHPIFLDRRT
jgi:hypothetical protein